MTTRRRFLESVSAAAALAALPRALHALPGAPLIRERLDRFGVQLYTVRTEMQKSIETTLAAVAEAGYREVEFAGYFSREPAALRAQLDALKLTAPSAHVSLDALERDWPRQAAAAKALGHRWLIVASVDTSKLPSTAEWKALAGRFAAVGKRAVGDGLRFGYHNHNVELKPLADGARPLDILLGETDPALVDFEMDLYWAMAAGAEPLDYFAKYPGRFRCVHVKDGSPRPEFAMRDVGSGIIDWARIFAKHRQAGIEHYFVEHDQPTDPLASIQASAKYLKQLSF